MALGTWQWLMAPADGDLISVEFEFLQMKTPFIASVNLVREISPPSVIQLNSSASPINFHKKKSRSHDSQNKNSPFWCFCFARVATRDQCIAQAHSIETLWKEMRNETRIENVNKSETNENRRIGMGTWTIFSLKLNSVRGFVSGLVCEKRMRRNPDIFCENILRFRFDCCRTFPQMARAYCKQNRQQ